MANGNVYQMVTDRIIAELEKERIPWKSVGQAADQAHITESLRNLTL